MPDRLAALGYPLQDKGRCSDQTTCRAPLTRGAQPVNVLFVFDEYTDVAREEEVQVMANLGMDALPLG